MSIVAPSGRKHLSADALFRLVQSGFASLPDYRVGDTETALADALMSAFAMFSLKAPSLLAFDKERAEGNLHTIDMSVRGEQTLSGNCCAMGKKERVQMQLSQHLALFA